jgi:Uncharacterised nucleotidyltransferase
LDRSAQVQGDTPTPDAELALLLVGTARRRERAADRIGRLAAAVDQDALAAVLTAHRVLPLAGTRLVEAEPAAVTGAFRRRVQTAHARARMRAMGFSAATGGIVAAFDGAGIEAVPLKGPALAGELYGDEALREYADIDILVAAEHLDRAAAVARALGWSREDPIAAGLPRLHRRLQHPDASLPAVELHWRIHWYEARFARALLERSRVRDGLRRLDRLDQLAALLLFYARDGFAGLRYAADIAAWWDCYGSPAVSPALERLMAEYPALAEPWRAGLTAAVSVAGLPAEVAPEACRPRARRSRLATRLANWDLSGDPDQIYANVALIDGLLAPRRGLTAFMRRQLLGLGGAHAAKMLVRSLIALWRLRGHRRWSPPPAVP